MDIGWAWHACVGYREGTTCWDLAKVHKRTDITRPSTNDLDKPTAVETERV